MSHAEQVNETRHRAVERIEHAAHTANALGEGVSAELASTHAEVGFASALLYLGDVIAFCFAPTVQVQAVDDKLVSLPKSTVTEILEILDVIRRGDFPTAFRESAHRVRDEILGVYE